MLKIRSAFGQHPDTPCIDVEADDPEFSFIGGGAREFKPGRASPNTPATALRLRILSMLWCTLGYATC